MLDNLERALGHGSATRDWASLEQGLQMTQKQFEDTLARYGVKRSSRWASHSIPRSTRPCDAW